MILAAQNSVFVHIRRGDYVGIGCQLGIDYQKRRLSIWQSACQTWSFLCFAKT
ncbi:hypothetical protein HpKG115_01110 [Helicobacter pylori]